GEHGQVNFRGERIRDVNVGVARSDPRCRARATGSQRKREPIEEGAQRRIDKEERPVDFLILAVQYRARLFIKTVGGIDILALYLDARIAIPRQTIGPYRYDRYIVDLAPRLNVDVAVGGKRGARQLAWALRRINAGKVHGVGIGDRHRHLAVDQQAGPARTSLRSSRSEGYRLHNVVVSHVHIDRGNGVSLKVGMGRNRHLTPLKKRVVEVDFDYELIESNAALGEHAKQP